MNYLYALFFAMFLSNVAFAQPDNGKKTVVIPRVKDPEVKATTIPAATAAPRFKAMEFAESIEDKDKVLTFPKEGNKPFQIGETVEKKPEKFANPREIPKNAIPKMEGNADSKLFRRNMDFGEITTKGDKVKILLRDFGAIDGDVVKISVNGMVFQERVSLEDFRRTVTIGLVDGFNYFEIEALNEGTQSPNTGEFIYMDDKDQLLKADQWVLSTGFKARLLIIKIK